MKSSDPNFEQYAQILQKTMADAIASAEAVKAAAMADREAAQQELEAAREALKEAEKKARTFSEEYLDEHRKALVEKTREDTLREVAGRLLRSSVLLDDIAGWLDVPLHFVEQVRVSMLDRNFDLPGARLVDQQSGRGGTFTFLRDKTSIVFHWEFGGGNAMALIFVPTAEKWQAATGLPVEERLPVLDFVARQVIDRYAKGCRYEISDNTIEILKS